MLNPQSMITHNRPSDLKMRMLQANIANRGLIAADLDAKKRIFNLLLKSYAPKSLPLSEKNEEQKRAMMNILMSFKKILGTRS